MRFYALIIPVKKYRPTVGFCRIKTQKRPILQREQAFTMPKHHCTALLIFHDAETPLRNTGDFLPDAETPLFSTFHFLPFPKTSQPPSLFPKQFRLALVSFFLFPLLKHRQPFISIPHAETPLFIIFHFFPPPLFSHCFRC